jgi:hypothetical protein
MSLLTKMRSGIASLMVVGAAVASCETPAEPPEPLTLTAPDTVHGTIKIGQPANLPFLECLLPVRIEARDLKGASATWVDGYWGYAPLGAPQAHAWRTYTAEELSGWWAFGSPSIHPGESKSWEMWFGFAPDGYWVRGYFRYRVGQSPVQHQLDYSFVCKP